MNEFKVTKSIGKGAYSKVKLVIRYGTDEVTGETTQEAYAMKVINVN